MNLSSDIKPISYLKSKTAEVINEANENKRAIIITQNGEAKVVIQDIKTYENMQNSIHLLKLIVQSENDIAKAILFYEKQKDKLGEYFLDSIMSDIESLYIYYGIHFKVKDYFRVLSKRFPFSIYYKFDKNFIYIYVVLDCRQNPILLNTRLEK